MVLSILPFIEESHELLKALSRIRLFQHAIQLLMQPALVEPLEQAGPNGLPREPVSRWIPPQAKPLSQPHAAQHPTRIIDKTARMQNSQPLTTQIARPIKRIHQSPETGRHDRYRHGINGKVPSSQIIPQRSPRDLRVGGRFCIGFLSACCNIDPHVLLRESEARRAKLLVDLKICSEAFGNGSSQGNTVSFNCHIQIHGVTSSEHPIPHAASDGIRLHAVLCRHAPDLPEERFDRWRNHKAFHGEMLDRSPTPSTRVTPEVGRPQRGVPPRVGRARWAAAGGRTRPDSVGRILWSWMILRMNNFQSRSIHVGISLRRADTGMAEQLLHRSQIRSSF